MRKQSLFKRVTSRLPRVKFVKADTQAGDRKISVVAPSLSGRAQNLPHDFVTMMAEGFKGNDLVYACMKEKADSVKEPPIKLYDNEGAEVEHPIRTLLARPNPFITEEKMLEKIQYHLDSAGNAYIHKVRARSGGVVELWNKQPDKVRPIPHEWEFISGWEIKVGSSWYPVAANDIIHFTYTDPENDFFGFPPLAAEALRIDIDNELSKYIKYVLANMAVTTGIYTTEGTTIDEVFERNKQELMELHQGAVNAGKPFYVEGGVKYQKIGLTLDELDFGNLWPEVSLRICSALQVPPILIGTKAGLDKSSYANYKEAKKSFYDETVTPLWGMIAGGFEHGLFEDFNLDQDKYSLKADTADVTALAEDEDKLYQRAKDTADILEVDERRAIIGKEPFANGSGKYVYLPMSQMPMLGSGSDTTTKAVAKARQEFKDFFPALERKDLSDFDNQVVKILRKVQNAYYPVFLSQAKTLFKIIADEYNQALDDLNIKALTDIQKAKLVKKLEEINKRLKRTFAVQLSFEDAIQTAAVEIGKAVGIDFDITNPLVQDFVAQYPFKFAEKIGESSVDIVKTIIAKADEEGWHVREISKALRDEFKDWPVARAEMVARTEIIRSSNSGARASYSEAGAKELVWMVTGDSRVCEWCSDLDGKVVGIEENFFNQGDRYTVEVADAEGNLVDKTMKLDYEDVENCPLHPLCRCSIGARF